MVFYAYLYRKVYGIWYSLVFVAGPGDAVSSLLYLALPLHLTALLPSSRRRRDVLVRVLELVVFPHVMLSPPLRRDVLDHHLAHVSLHEPADESRVPEFGRDSQVLAAAHESVGFAAFGRGGDAVGVEVLLFAAGEGDEARTES